MKNVEQKARGEGNYIASQRYRDGVERFVKNDARLLRYASEAKRALDDVVESKILEEARTRSHFHRFTQPNQKGRA